MSDTYLIALGSNMRVPGIGGPRLVLEAALGSLEVEGVAIEAASPIIDSSPIGPSLRRYANSAAVVSSDLNPPALLAKLHEIERDFGRNRSQRRGQSWRARALDLDIILWSGGIWTSPDLAIPHYAMRERDFVLDPASSIAADWRDPLTGLSIAQLYARLTKPRPQF